MHIPDPFDITELRHDMIAHLKHLNDRLNEDGLRVVAVAFKKFSTVPNSFQKSDEVDMIFAGFIGFLDPPKESVKEAIQMLIDHNVKIKVLTGDSAVVCQKICDEIKLPVTSLVTSAELEG